MLDLNNRRGKESPFRHWIFDDVISHDHLCELHGSAPLVDWPKWIRYDNGLECKRTTRDVWTLAEPLFDLFAVLLSAEMAKTISGLFGIGPLQADATLHGGGLHVMPPGGFLQTHLDYALHANGMERRLNLVMFLHSLWADDWGGELELLAADGETRVERIQPRPGRMVLFEAGDTAYHGVAEVAGPVPRITANVSFLTPPRENVTRQRALFVPRR